MDLSILVDMNLSSDWVEVLNQAGWHAVAWSQIGDPRATDQEIMEWARKYNHVVFTHDLDFTTMLALTRAQGPSILQVRARNVLPGYLKDIVLEALSRSRDELLQGALVVVESSRIRIRILPL